MKRPTRPNAQAPASGTTRLSTRVSVEAYQRLFVASVMNGETAGEILDRLILAHCREWSLPGKIAARVEKSHRHDSAPELNLDAPAMTSDLAA